MLEQLTYIFNIMNLTSVKLSAKLNLDNVLKLDLSAVSKLELNVV